MHIYPFIFSEAHHLTVKRLKFRPELGDPEVKEESTSKKLLLASGGADHIVRIYSINLDSIDS